MGKRHLLIAGAAMLLSMGASAQSTQTYGWEDFNDGIDAFTSEDPEYIRGTLDGFEFYVLTHEENDKDNAYGDPAPYDPADKQTVFIDTLVELRNSIDDYTRSYSENGPDEYALNELDDTDINEFAALGVDNSEGYYLRYIAQRTGTHTSKADDWDACVFVRGLGPLPEHNSYRVSFYMRVDTVAAYLDMRLMRGWSQSEKPFVMGDLSTKFTYVVDASKWIQTIGEYKDTLDENLNHWRRYTYMTYFSDSALMNQYCQKSFSSWWKWEYPKNSDHPWSSSTKYKWNNIFQSLRYKLTPEQDELFRKQWDQEESSGLVHYDTVMASKVVQPNAFFLRMSFRGPGTNYDIDNIGIYQSTIGAAECSGNIIRIDFGYETNMDSLIDISATKDLNRVVVPKEAFKVTYKKDGQIEEKEIVSVEYQKGGFAYIWLEDGFETDETEPMLSFNNSQFGKELRLRYNGSNYPFFDDEEFMAGGRYIKDFENEQILPATFEPIPNMEDLPPSVLSADPEFKSFGLRNDQRTLTFNLDKNVYIDSDDPENTLIAVIYGGRGAVAIDPESPVMLTLETETVGKQVTFSIPDDAFLGAPTLDGVYTVEISNLHAAIGEEGEYFPSDFTEEQTTGPAFIEYSWGDPNDVLKEDTKKKSTVYICNKKVVDAYTKDTVFINENADVECKSLEDFKVLVQSYEPKAFLMSHQAPSEYDAAAEVLATALAEVTDIVANVKQFTTTIARAESAVAALKGKYSNTVKFQNLEAALAEAKKIDSKTADGDVLVAANKALVAACALAEAMPSLTAQADSLVAMNNKLGNDVLKDADIAALYKDLEDDDVTLVALLKLEAVKAIYTKLNAHQNVDSIDATGFIVNPNFYLTGTLYDKSTNPQGEIEYYQAKQDTPLKPWKYRVREKDTLSTVFPGWSIYTRYDTDFAVNPGNYKEGTYAPEGGAVPGSIYADWKSGFTLSQVITDLPAGKYTIANDAHYDGSAGDTGKEDKLYLIVNEDTLETTYAKGAMLDPQTITGNYEGTLNITFINTKYKTHLFMEHFNMGYSAEYDPSKNYEDLIKDVQKKIDDIKAEAEVIAADANVEFYNLNGVKLDAVEAGQIVIRLTNGVAEKIIY